MTGLCWIITTCTLYLPHVSSPHPADPTLTTDNLMEVVKGVKHRWYDLDICLGVSVSKMNEVERLYHSGHQRMEAVLDYYVKYHPALPGKEFAGKLQVLGLHKQADAVTAKYVKGMDVNHVTCLILIQAVDGQLWY